MNHESFCELDIDQQITLMVSMHIRESMEGFHAEYLDDGQMKELNQIIRQAVFDVLFCLRQAPQLSSKPIRQLVLAIPYYWEIPDTPSGRLLL